MPDRRSPAPDCSAPTPVARDPAPSSSRAAPALSSAVPEYSDDAPVERVCSPDERSAAPAASQSATASTAADTATTTATAISPVGYADRTIRAFGAGDDIDLATYTTADARRAIIAHEGGAKHWQRTGAEGAAGHVYVTYANTETGDELVIGVDVSDGTGHDHLVDTAR